MLAPKKLASLNIRLRKETLKKITAENQQMLKRLVKGKPTVTLDRWEKQY